MAGKRGRPRKTDKTEARVEDQWFDIFADMEVSDQAAALRIISMLHRQALREVKYVTVVTGGDAVDVPNA
jgi:hypothetical protein